MLRSLSSNLRLDSDARPQLSVLDRLFDDNPGVQQEVPPNRFQAVRQYKDAVIRDLEWLLNSRANPEEATEDFPQLRDSSYSYGLGDFSALQVSTSDKAKVARLIQRTIELHEPRLTEVTVELPDTSGVQKIHFRVIAVLQMTPAPEQVSFDTELDLSQGSYKVKGG